MWWVENNKTGFLYVERKFIGTEPVINLCQFLINEILESWQALICIKKGLRSCQQRDENQVFVKSSANHLCIAKREGAPGLYKPYGTPQEIAKISDETLRLRFKPISSYSSDVITIEFLYKNFVVYCIKSFAKIKKNSTGIIAIINSFLNFISN